MRIGLISGAYPPDFDGIGDYTWWLAQTLALRSGVDCPVRVFTSGGTERPVDPGVEVYPIFDSPRPASFRELLRCPAITELDWLVLQYNPFSFGPRGYCPWVPETLALLQKSRNGPRIAVMFHETVVPRWPWKFAVMYCWQQPIFRAVCRVADVAFVSTERWIPQVQRIAPQLPVRHLPVGSNIPLCRVSREEARERLGIEQGALVLGVFGGAHISRRLGWIAATVREVRKRNTERPTLLLYVGADGRAVQAACPEANIIDSGPVPGMEVGLRLRAMDAMVSPFLDGISTRRGSVIAALQHGVPVASTRSSWTDRVFLAMTPIPLLLSVANSATRFAIEVSGWLERLRGIPQMEVQSEVCQFHGQHFLWSAISGKLQSTLSCGKS